MWFALLHSLLFTPQTFPFGSRFSHVTGGTFTLRWTSPAINQNCNVTSTTCAISLSGTPISAGDLLVYECTMFSGGIISSVSNTGAFTFAKSSVGIGTSGASMMSGGVVLVAGAESGSTTITFNIATQGTCLVTDYSYTGTPQLDGANAFGQVASSTTLVVPTFTPSAGSNNDVYVHNSFTPFTPASSISAPFTLLGETNASWAYDNNSTSALSPTWTWGSAQSNTISQSIGVGFNVTAYANEGVNFLSGTNAATVTAASLAASHSGYAGGVWQLNGSGTFTYQTSASYPTSGSTGRLNDGGNYTDSSTTGIELAGGASSGHTTWNFGTSNAGQMMSTTTLTAGMNIIANLPATDVSPVDTFNIFGTGAADFQNALLGGNATNRYVTQECASGDAHFQDFLITQTASFTNGSASISATNVFVAGSRVQFITTSALPTNFTAGTTYFVIATGLSTSAFQVSATLGGSAITAGSAGTGTQSVVPWYHYLESFDPAPFVTATFTNGSASISATNSYVAGQPVGFHSTGTLPTNFSTNPTATYYVLATGLTGSTFQVAATVGGTAIVAGSAGSGTQTVTTGVHTIKLYTGWTSPSSLGALAATLSCAGLGITPSMVFFGNANNAFTTGFWAHFDSLFISLDAGPL